jgi:6-pyruvoyltetrahydropterin/6-carboxytetrahydropterin synthase
MLTLSIQLKDFAAAHRLILGYEGKCANLHGHNYGLHVKISAEKLDRRGFIADITKVKSVLNNWVSEHLDHSVLISQADEALLVFLRQEKQKFYLIPEAENTTLEYLSKHLHQIFNSLLKPLNVCLIAVTLSENQTAYATYEHY